jgi:hypothetical protein
MIVGKYRSVIGRNIKDIVYSPSRLTFKVVGTGIRKPIKVPNLFMNFKTPCKSTRLTHGGFAKMTV